MIIFDASPLIHLTKIGKLEYIINIFDSIIISNAVYKEVIEDGIKAGYTDAILLLNYFKKGKIKEITIENPDLLLNEYLHPGESESMIAEQKNIEFLTTADVLLLLLKEKKINFDFFQKNLSKYSADGWLGANIFQKYLEEGKKYE